MRADAAAIVAAGLLAGWAGVAGPVGPVVPPAPAASCRSDSGSPTVRWSRPADAAERRRLDAWCAAVGPVVYIPLPVNAERTSVDPAGEVAFVSWNVHVGAGEIDRFVADLRRGRFSDGRPVSRFALLLQEAVRVRGVPLTPPRGGSAAKWIGSDKTEAIEIEAAARRLGLSLLYAPSMRNGPLSVQGRHPTDRGNAILSSLPLSEPAAIELPIGRQRRVAVVARLPLAGPAGGTIAVGSAHLDVLGKARTLWLFGAARSRARQAISLIDALPPGPAILGADTNSWLGADEMAVRVLRESFPATPDSSGLSTFRGGLSLDYVFFRLQQQPWQATLTGVPDRYGSDHSPLIGWLSSKTGNRPH